MLSFQRLHQKMMAQLAAANELTLTRPHCPGAGSLTTPPPTPHPPLSMPPPPTYPSGSSISLGTVPPPASPLFQPVSSPPLTSGNVPWSPTRSPILPPQVSSAGSRSIYLAPLLHTSFPTLQEVPATDSVSVSLVPPQLLPSVDSRSNFLVPPLQDPSTGSRSGSVAPASVSLASVPPLQQDPTAGPRRSFGFLSLPNLSTDSVSSPPVPLPRASVPPLQQAPLAGSRPPTPISPAARCLQISTSPSAQQVPTSSGDLAPISPVPWLYSPLNAAASPPSPYPTWQPQFAAVQFSPVESIAPAQSGTSIQRVVPEQTTTWEGPSRPGEPLSSVLDAAISFEESEFLSAPLLFNFSPPPYQPPLQHQPPLQNQSLLQHQPPPQQQPPPQLQPTLQLTGTGGDDPLDLEDRFLQHQPLLQHQPPPQHQPLPQLEPTLQPAGTGGDDPLDLEDRFLDSSTLGSLIGSLPHEVEVEVEQAMETLEQLEGERPSETDGLPGSVLDVEVEQVSRCTIFCLCLLGSLVSFVVENSSLCD